MSSIYPLFPHYFSSICPVNDWRSTGHILEKYWTYIGTTPLLHRRDNELAALLTFIVRSNTMVWWAFQSPEIRKEWFYGTTFIAEKAGRDALFIFARLVMIAASTISERPFLMPGL